MSVTIKTVTTKKDLKSFVRFANNLYKGNKYWVHPLRGDMQSVFDKDKNPLYAAGGELIRWILYHIYICL